MKCFVMLERLIFLQMKNGVEDGVGSWSGSRVGINIVGDDRGLKRIPKPHSIVSFLNFIFFNFECLRLWFHHNHFF